jgi:signal transduction histidine kinase
VNKYAQATKCFVFLLKKGTKISLQISDNGVGFDIEKKKQGIGLKNMQQRAKSIKGSFSIVSDSSGTTIEILF